MELWITKDPKIPIPNILSDPLPGQHVSGMESQSFARDYFCIYVTRIMPAVYVENLPV